MPVQMRLSRTSEGFAKCRECALECAVCCALGLRQIIHYCGNGSLSYSRAAAACEAFRRQPGRHSLQNLRTSMASAELNLAYLQTPKETRLTIHREPTAPGQANRGSRNS